MAMVISGMDKGSSSFGMQIGNANMDSQSRSIQKQIADKQKELQELSSKEGLTLEEKMKKRQEINQEINDLNLQLRQHQMEVSRKARQKKGNTMDEMLGGAGERRNKADKNTGTGMTGSSMQSIISADMSMDQVRVQDSVKTSLEGRAEVLKAELNQDGGNGVSSEKKEAELAALQDKAADVEKEQMGAISDIQEGIHRATEEEHQSAEGEEKTEEEQNPDTKSLASEETKNGDQQEAASDKQTETPADYRPVDIRL